MKRNGFYPRNNSFKEQILAERSRFHSVGRLDRHDELRGYDRGRADGESNALRRPGGWHDATGHAGSTNYLRSAFLFLAEFRPDAYQAMLAGARLTENGTTTAYDNFSRFLWVKYRRSLQGQPESATKVNSLVSVDVARTGTVDELMLVRNASSSPLQGPLFLALSSAPVGVTLDNALAEGSKAGPYVPIPLGSELLPGQFTLVPVKLRAPNGNAQAAGWTVFSGEPE